jgi:hypothetical protein
MVPFWLIVAVGVVIAALVSTPAGRRLVCCRKRQEVSVAWFMGKESMSENAQVNLTDAEAAERNPLTKQSLQAEV